MFASTTRKIIRRLSAITIATGLGIVGLGAAPAAADAPAEFSVTFTFTDANPCTGEEHDITITANVSEHRGHDGKFVGRASRSGTTSDGYVMDHGRDAVVFNGNNASGSLNDTWRNDAGSIFKAQGHFLEKNGEVVIDTFRLRCINA
jgi:hypothetical protein